MGVRAAQADKVVGAVAGLGERERVTAGYDLLAELDEGLDDVAEVQCPGTAAADGKHVGGEARLRGRVAPELIQHHLRRRVALQLDDDSDALAARFVANVRDALDALILSGLGDLLDNSVLADL